MRNYLLFIISIMCLVGCAKRSADYYNNEKIQSEKLIAIDAGKSIIRVHLEKYLKERGFRVVRNASIQRKSERTNTGHIEYNEAATPYLLDIEYSLIDTCFGGGYDFARITASLVDTRTDETIAVYNDSGLSEDCPPLSGKIFERIADFTNNAWEKK